MKGKNPEKVRKILNHIAPAQIQNATAFHVPEEKQKLFKKKNVFGIMFSKPYAKGTVLLLGDLLHGTRGCLLANKLVTNTYA